MLRISGPKWVDTVDITLVGLTKDNVDSIRFHLMVELEDSSLSLAIYNNGLFIRGYLEMSPNQTTMDRARCLVGKISKILNRSFNGVIVINSQLFDYEVTP